MSSKKERYTHVEGYPIPTHQWVDCPYCNKRVVFHKTTMTGFLRYKCSDYCEHLEDTILASIEKSNIVFVNDEEDSDE